MRKPLGIAVLALGAAAVLWVSTGATSWLDVRHEFQSRLKPLSAVTTIDVERVGPIRMFLNPDDEVITPRLWAGQVWEATETHWFVQSIRPGDVVVDVGANVGYYTILGGLLVGETGRVYAFEPDPVAFEILRRNVALHRLHNVVLEQKAVSNEAGGIQFYIAESNKGDHRIYQPEGEQRASMEVEAVRLDAYFDGVEEAVDFVKVDTQGAEAMILEGMMNLVRRSEEIVMAFEYSPRHLAGLGSTAQELLANLMSLQLRMFVLGRGGPDIQPLKPATPHQLLRAFSPERRLFTNLLLVKGRRDLLAQIEAESTGR